MSESKKIDFTKVKIKQEKSSPPPSSKIQKKPDEIIEEIIPKLFGTPPRKDNENDEKKSISPVKSSNEILAELFKVFNSAPPETLLNDDYLLQKEKKDKKDKKHKKKSKKSNKSSSDDESNDGSKKSDDDDASEGGSQKKRKKKKKKKSSKRDDSSDDGSDKHSEKRKSDKTKRSRDKSVNRKEKSSDRLDFEASEYEKEKELKNSKSTSILKHIKVEKDVHDKHHHHHHHHRNHNDQDDDKKQKQPELQIKIEKSSDAATTSRKIIIKSAKDTKIFKEAEEKQRESKESSSKHTSNTKHHDRERELNYEKSSSEKQQSKSNVKEDSSHRKRSDSKRENPEKRNSRRESSEISLSDEETYLREKEMGLYKSSSSYDDRKSSRHSNYHGDRSSRSNYRGSSRDRSRSYYRRNRWRSRSRSRSRSKSRSRYRGRSRSRSTELVIDKKRLLEIARKNAISMFKNGSLPGTQEMSQEVKDKVLMRMRYGGKSVEELTEFCKKLSKGESLNDLSDLSSNEDSDHDKSGNEKAFHHPFVLKDRGPIVMNIKNATQIAPKTADQTKAILMQFPVSSGQQHRLTENDWVPVSPKRTESSATTVTQTVAQPSKPQPPKNIFQKPLPQNEEQQPAFLPTNPLATTTSVTTVAISTTTSTPSTTTTEVAFVATTANTSTTSTAAVMTPVISVTTSNTVPIAPPPSLPMAIPLDINTVPLPPVPPPIIPMAPPPTIHTLPPPAIVAAPLATAPLPPTSDFTMDKANESIFPEQSQSIDVSTVIAKRLNAMRKLQENPADPEALKMMYDAQKNMSAWANSKYMPGQFTGSTGANILTAKELAGGHQAWAKRDQLTSTTPVSGGMGMHLLQKMGWKPGEGLGKTKNGALQPLLLDVKIDKRGLVATEEDPSAPKIKRKKINAVQVQKSMEEKHPVSLLDEISAKRKWGPPAYEVVSDDGPSHRKSFIFQVIVNGVMYQPTIPCRTKKEAKALAAKYCLQQLGILTN